MKKDHFASIFLFVLLSAGCSQPPGSATTPGNAGGQANSAQEVPPDTGPAPAAFAPTADPRADIDKMSERFQAVTSFKAKMTGEGKTPINTEMEFAAPDRYRLKTANAMETIVIGRATLIKVGDAWRLFQLPLDPSIRELRTAFGKDELKGISDVKYVGDEPVNGKWAYAYTYHMKGPNNSGESDSKLWVAKSSGLPLKLEAAYRAGNLKTMAIEYDYDTPVVIEPPSQVAPARPGYQY